MTDDSGRASDPRISTKRRRLLAALAGSGMVGVAGCLGGGDGNTETTASGDGTETSARTDTGTAAGDGATGTTTDTEGDGTPTGDGTPAGNETAGGSPSGNQTSGYVREAPEPNTGVEMVDGATLKTFMGDLPSNPDITWNPYVYRNQWPRLVYPLAMDQMAAVSETTNELIPMAVESYSIAGDGTSWSLTFADGNWSDGTPVQGKDYGMPYLLDRWALSPTPDEIRNSDTGPTSAFEAVTDVTWDSKTVTVHSEPGWFSQFWMENELRNVLTALGSTSISTQAEAHWRELYDQVSDNPWTQESREAISTFQDEMRSYTPDDPSSVPVTGPFSVNEVNESGVILQKNPEFRLADAINWERVEVSPMPESRARAQALQSNNLDYISGKLTTPNVQVIEALPDNIRRHPHTPGGMVGIVLNSQQRPLFADDRVRQAIAYALNKEQIVGVGNQYTTQAPPPFGLGYPVMNQWISEDVRSTFRSYEYDPERATSLMQEAGLTRENGEWIHDGQPLQIPYLVGTQGLQAVQVIKQQLGEFGIQVELNTQSGTILEERTGQGDFVMTNETWANPLGLYIRALGQSDRRHRFNVWSDEEVTEWVENTEGVTNEVYDWTNNVEGWTAEQLGDWTIEAPPVGQPDSDERVEYPVAQYDFVWSQNLSDQRRQEVMTRLAWALNWNLPLIPYSQSNQLAFQDHGDWNAPEDGDIWRQYEPQPQLIKQGLIQANPDA